MKTMIIFILFSAVLIAAEDSKFEERKAKVISKLDQESSYIVDAKSCVESASEKGQIKECMKALHSKKKASRLDRREKRKARRSEKKKRLQEKLDKMEEPTQKSPQ